VSNLVPVANRGQKRSKDATIWFVVVVPTNGAGFVDRLPSLNTMNLSGTHYGMGAQACSSHSKTMALSFT